MNRLKNDIVPDQQWRFGLLLQNPDLGCLAKIRVHEKEKQITIQVQGEQRRKREYFAIIRHVFCELNRSFKKLKVTERIPLPGHPGQSVEYEELLGYEKANERKYLVGKLNKKFDVAELLDTIISREERMQERQKDEGSPRILNQYFIMNQQNQANPHFEANPHMQQNQQANPQIQVNPNIKVDSNVQATLTAQQQQTATQEIKNIQGAFKNLKDDILAELEIEDMETKEKKRLQNELQKIDQSFTALEDAATAGQKQLAPADKNRLTEFVDNLSNEDSRLRKALGYVESGVQKAQKLGHTYNKFAPYFGLPNVPPVFLGAESGEDLKK